MPLAVCRREGTQKKEAPSRTNSLRYVGTTLSLLGCHQERFMIPQTCVEKETQIIRSLRGESNPVQTYPNLFSSTGKKNVNCFYMYRPHDRSPTESHLIKCILWVHARVHYTYKNPWQGCSYSEGNLSSLLKTTHRFSLSV